LLLTAFLHGKPKTGYHNIFVQLVNTALTIAILLWGGFFR
jgi:hypothetical protein